MNKKLLLWTCFFIIYADVSLGSGHRHFHKKLKKVQKNALKAANDSDKEIFLRITKHMKDQNATSGGNVHFKCKIEGWPNKKVQYTWYKDDALIDPLLDPRVSVKTRAGGSKLSIADVFTVDSGVYRCEASNTHRRVHTSARLTVFFQRPPPPKDENSKLNIPAGKCEKYKGLVCSQFLHGVNIFIDSFENQEDKENLIKNALQNISNSSFSSSTCEKFTLPAFCHFVFIPCRIEENGATNRGERLCREDCQLLKRDICNNEFSNGSENAILKNLFDSANCSYLPSAKDSDCVRIGVPYLKTDPTCYVDKGEGYRGQANVADSGEQCQVWPLDMARKHPELLGGHNFCRNPGGLMAKPWCFVDRLQTQKKLCNMESCDVNNRMGRNLIILISSASGAIFILFGVILCCVQCNRKKQTYNPSNFDKKADLFTPEINLRNQQEQTNPSPLRVNLTSVWLLTDIGNGNYGKVYKGSIINDPRFCKKQPIAFKVLDSCHVISKLEAFKFEMEILSKLQHPNITNLKAFAVESKTKVLAFEFTNQVNLYEHLLLNSPLSTNSKSMSISSHTKHGISVDSFTKMALQIASGMEYLSKNNYLHRDLAARNVLVCGNMDLKISNVGVIKDCYLSNYYKTPEGSLMPIRWMAPESLQCWQFSDQSTVWSFGVLLWEMFSFGMQPYCGYSNHEVLDVIARQQLLSCPDQCPAKIYTLMMECWKEQPSKRLSFSELRNRFQSFLQTSTFLPVPPTYKNEKTMPPPSYQSEPISSQWQVTVSESERSQLLEFEKHRHPI